MKRAPASPPPAARDWPVAALAGAGLAISAYLTWTKWTGAAALFCERGSGCDVVQASTYSTFLGVPTASWGVLLYAVVLGLALVGLTPRRWGWVYALAVAAVAFSAYLTYLEVWELRALCPWCLTDAGVAAALLVTLLLRRPSPSGRRSPARPQRLVAVGLASAVVTVVFAAGVFVTHTSGTATAYQEGLARHLTDSGAIFYGAFW